MSKKPDTHSDQDKLPFTAPPFATPAPRKRAPRKKAAGAAAAGGEPYRGHQDPEMYERLSRPWPSREAAHVAIGAFFEEAHALRVKHGIADVTILAAVEVNEAGKTAGFMHSHHSGDSRNQLAMVASAFRSLRERNDEAARAMAGLAAPDVVTLTKEGTERVERITKAILDRLDGGTSWTPSDTMTALMLNEALRCESHGALLDLVCEGPRSPAEEMGALRGAFAEILSVAGSRAARITKRIREIEAEHPELKVESPPTYPDEPGTELKAEEQRDRQRRAAGIYQPPTAARTAVPGEIEHVALTEADVLGLLRLQAVCYPRELHDTEEEVRKLVGEAEVALGARDVVGDRLVGAVFVTRPTPDGSLELYSVEVAPVARHRGVATRLVRAALEAAPKGPMEAYCTRDGLALLRTLGFVENGKKVTRGGVALVGMQVGEASTAPVPSSKERDLEWCLKQVADVKEARREDGEKEEPTGLTSLARVERNWAIAILLHHGDENALAEVKARVDLLSRYLMWQGGTDFLNRCRVAVREEQWGRLLQHVAALEDDLVSDLTLRWAFDPETRVVRAEPTPRTAGRDGSIPTSIDPGGIGL